MTTPRPDQSHVAGFPGMAGSRSGSADLAAGLGYPGIPPAALNMLSDQKLRSGAGVTAFHTFSAPARIWSVSLSYAILTDGTFPAGAVFVDSLVSTVLGGVALATVQLGLSVANQHAELQTDRVLPGLAVTKGESVQLAVNNGAVISGMFQRASALILYSVP